VGPPGKIRFDLKSPPVVEDPERFYRSGVLPVFVCSFSYPCKKTNQKKTPVSRFLLRVVNADARVGTRCAQTGRRAFSVRTADARRGTKGT
jgi:hypothetical protein